MCSELEEILWQRRQYDERDRRDKLKDNECHVQGVSGVENGCCGSCGSEKSGAEPSLIAMLEKHSQNLEKMAIATEGLINTVGALVYQNAVLIEMISTGPTESDEPTKYMDGSPIYPKGSKDN